MRALLRQRARLALQRLLQRPLARAPLLAVCAGTQVSLNTKGYSSTYLAMGFANVRAGTRYPPEH